ncbi:MAG: Yip1 family protein [Pseudohongiella sp.]|uniref:Yip1 family protein n=1 Tax=Pseudohongiella sp. TaxID=1979412 RepID=UPI0034A0893C
MSSNISSLTLFRSLYQPQQAFAELAKADPSSRRVFLTYSLWLLLLPPLFSLIGAANFGWRLGADQPLFMATGDLLTISVGYFVALLFGLFSTVIISRWMAKTYGASVSLGRHMALITMVGQPLAMASIAHLFPDVLVNVLVLIPATIWGMYLLYAGIPVALETPPERGMLMASALMAWLLVAAVSLLGISMSLWVLGVGPLLGV